MEEKGDVASCPLPDPTKETSGYPASQKKLNLDPFPSLLNVTSPTPFFFF